jgi:uncharacterized protein YbjT (DUF2867 family)
VALKQLGAQLVTGSFEDRSALEAAARGVDTLFAMSTPYVAGVDAEIREGLAVVDAAKAAGVKHLVYTSVADADRRTGIPHFESKMLVENRVRETGLAFTILAPVFFAENLISPWSLPGLQKGEFKMAMPATRKLQHVALADLSALTALVVEQRDRFLGRRINIASFEITGADLAAAVTRASRREIRYVEQPLAEVRSYSADTAAMLEWFDRVGYSADLAGLRREYKEVAWHTAEQWVSEQDWSVLAQPVG